MVWNLMMMIHKKKEQSNFKKAKKLLKLNHFVSLELKKPLLIGLFYFHLILQT